MRHSISVIPACLICLLACTEGMEETQDIPSRTISIGIDNSTRTQLGSGETENHILWSKGDSISISDRNCHEESVRIDDRHVGTSNARFCISSDMEPQYTIVYPASAVHDRFTLSLPSSQTYVENSFSNNIAVLAGKGQDNIILRSLSSFVEVAVDSGITNMVFSSTGGEIVAGEFLLSEDADKLSAKAGSSSLHIDCTQLGGARKFIIAIPAGWYSTGFTIRMKGANESSYRYATAFKTGKELKCGVLYHMPELKLSSCEVSARTIITNPTELQEFLNAGNGVGEFGCDIDMSGITIVPCAEFSGEIDGQGFSIRNWNATTPLITSVSANGKVRNIVIDKSCSFNVTQSLKYFGYIAGNVYGTLSGCINNADINCTTPETEVSTQHIGGGICGNTYSGSMLSECVNNGNVTFTFNISTSSNQYIGGITGIINATSTAVRIRNCVNNGNVTVNVNMANQPSCKNINVGGIVSASGANSGSTSKTTGFTKNYGIIEGCINYGNITENSPYGSTGGYHLVGGITGYTEGSIRSCKNYGNITLAGSQSRSSSTPKVGGVAGFISLECSNCENHGKINVSGLFGNASNSYSTGVAGCYWASVAGVAGQIGDGEVKETSYISSCNNDGAIRAYNGMASANGSGNSSGGICAFAYGKVSDCHNTGNIETNTNDYTVRCGGVVGQAFSTVTNCTSDSSISFIYDSSHNTKEATSAQFVGGIVGCHNGSLVDVCRSNVKIKVTTSQGTIQPSQLLLGGIAGYANTAGTSISGSICKGMITAEGFCSPSKASGIGGICGRVKEGPVEIVDCVNESAIEVSTSGYTEVGSIAGYLAGRMKSCQAKGKVDVSNATSQSTAGGIAGCMAATVETDVVNDILYSGDIIMANCSEGTAVGGAFGSISGKTVMSGVTISGNINSSNGTSSGFIAGKWKDATADYTVGATDSPVILTALIMNGDSAPLTPSIETMVGDWQSITPTAPSGGMSFISYQSRNTKTETMLRIDDIAVEKGATSVIHIQYRNSEKDEWNDYDIASNPLKLKLSSSNQSVLEVSSDGSVSGVAEGTSTIKAQSPDRLSYATANARVEIYEVSISSMDLDRIIVSKFAKLPGNSVIQSFDIDRDWNIFYTQTYGGNKIYISRGKKNTDTTDDYATLWFHGHGTNTCIESIGNDRYVWCCNFGSKDSEGAYNSEQVVSRFKYANGLSIHSWEQTENYYMGPPAKTFGPVAIDHENDLVAFYHSSREESGRIVTMYRLSEIKALTPKEVTLASVKFGGETSCPEYPEQTKTFTIMAKKVSDLTPYARFKMPTLLQSMQGFDIQDGKCYIVSGAGGNNDGTPGTAYLSVCDYTGKVLMNSEPIKAISDVRLLAKYGITESGYMESEGCKIIDGKMYIGFASKSVNDGNRRRANIFKYRIPEF